MARHTGIDRVSSRVKYYVCEAGRMKVFVTVRACALKLSARTRQSNEEAEKRINRA